MKGAWWQALLAMVLGSALADALPKEALWGLAAVAGVLGWRVMAARVQALQARLAQAQAGPVQAPLDVPLDLPFEAPLKAPVVAPVEAPVQAPVETSAVLQPLAAPRPPAPTPTASAETDERSVAVTSSLGASLKAWFTGGNTIVRLAVLVLFVGVAFLVRYAAENAWLPIELRLAGTVLGGMAMVVAGWRLRLRRPGYGLTLQGGGIGVVYLVLFAALRMYGLLPAGLALALLVALCACTVLLALRQDAMPLAALAFAGAFLAPVLTSTGGGSHVVLFGYYLVLNLGIAWLATHRAWKLLNALGFVFTFGIGLAWGLRGWRPELWASTQPLLLAHLLLYLYITVQYSRQLLAAANARLPRVDGSLLFGVPIAGFALQAAIVRHLPYGLAVSAAVLAGIYLLLARWLWRAAGPRLRVLTEGMLALGVVFLALVVPLALDARWTGAAWALQGAGVAWVALRQQRVAALGLGLLLQGLAALSFWVFSQRGEAATFMANGHVLGGGLLAAAALATAWALQRHWPAAWRARVLATLHPAVLAAGLAHLLVVLWQELDHSGWPAPAVGALDRSLPLLLALAAQALHRRLAWPALATAARVLAGLALALSAGIGLLGMGMGTGTGAWAQWVGGLGLEALLLLAGTAWLLHRQGAAGSTALEHGAWLAYGLLVLGTLAHALAQRFMPQPDTWAASLLLAAPLAGLLAWHARWRAGRWPAVAHGQSVLKSVGLGLLGLGLLWSVLANLDLSGATAPLPHLPLLNPIDLTHVLLLLCGLRLWRSGLAPAWDREAGLGLQVLLAGVAFFWLNSVLVRGLHHAVGTPLWTQGALASGTVQAGFSLLWTACALVAMALASRRAWRPLWMAGAALLGAVVLKLLLVDMSHAGALMRIVSFIGVGLGMLLIGYLSPLPPAAAKEGAR